MHRTIARQTHARSGSDLSGERNGRVCAAASGPDTELITHELTSGLLTMCDCNQTYSFARGEEKRV